MRICKPTISEWDTTIAMDDDTAVAGKELQVQAMARHAIAEAAVKNGQQAVSILWDVEKLFDSIQRRNVIEAVETLDFPRDPLGLAMIIHRVPRLIDGV